MPGEYLPLLPVTWYTHVRMRASSHAQTRARAPPSRSSCSLSPLVFCPRCKTRRSASQRPARSRARRPCCETKCPNVARRIGAGRGERRARHCPPGPVCRAPVAHDKPGEVEPPCGQSAFSPGAVCRCSCGCSAERRRVCAMRRVSVTCKRGRCGTLKHVFERLTVFAGPDPIDPVVCSMAQAQHQAMPPAHSQPAGTASRHHAERQRARITPSGHVRDVARCRTRAHNTGAGLHGSLKRWAVELHERDLVDDLVHTCGR